MSARNGQLVLERYLCQSGAEVDMQDALGNSALHIAAACGFKSAIAVLLEMGGNATLTNKAGKKPVDVALDNVKDCFA